MLSPPAWGPARPQGPVPVEPLPTFATPDTFVKEPQVSSLNANGDTATIPGGGASKEPGGCTRPSASVWPLGSAP